MSARNLFVLSWTKIHLLRTCPLAWHRRYVDSAPELASMPAETGVAFHDVAADLEAATAPGATLDEGLVFRLLTRKSASLAEPAAKDLRFLVALLMKRGGLPGFPSDVQDQSYELRVALTADGKVCAWDDPAALFRGIFDQAWRENGGELAVIGDWKTGRLIEPPGDQLRLYAWAACCLWPEVTEVVGRNYWLRRSSKPDGSLFFAADLRGSVPAELWSIREDLQRRMREGDWKPRVTDFCRSCSFMSTCPAFKSGISPWRSVTTEEEARSAAEHLAILDGQIRMTRAALKAYVGEHGAFDLSDAEEYGPRPSQSVVGKNARMLARLFLSRGISDEQIWAELRLSKKGLNSLIWAACEHGGQREALTAELLAAGLIEQRTTGGGLRRRKKLPPELEGMEDDEEEPGEAGLEG